MGKANLGLLLESRRRLCQLYVALYRKETQEQEIGVIHRKPSVILLMRAVNCKTNGRKTEFRTRDRNRKFLYSI